MPFNLTCILARVCFVSLEIAVCCSFSLMKKNQKIKAVFKSCFDAVIPKLLFPFVNGIGLAPAANWKLPTRANAPDDLNPTRRLLDRRRVSILLKARSRNIKIFNINRCGALAALTYLWTIAEWKQCPGLPRESDYYSIQYLISTKRSLF